MIPKDEIAAGRVKIVFEFIASGTSLAMTVTTGASLRGGETDLSVTEACIADVAISLSMPFNNYGIAAERIKTKLSLRFI